MLSRIVLNVYSDFFLVTSTRTLMPYGSLVSFLATSDFDVVSVLSPFVYCCAVYFFSPCVLITTTILCTIQYTTRKLFTDFKCSEPKRGASEGIELGRGEVDT